MKNNNYPDYPEKCTRSLASEAEQIWVRLKWQNDSINTVILGNYSTNDARIQTDVLRPSTHERVLLH